MGTPSPETMTTPEAATRRRGWTIGRRLLAGFAATLGLMAVIGLASYANTRALVANSEAVSHTQDVLRDTVALLSALKDAETGQRGYLITGEDQYLEPYVTARAAADDALAGVRDPTRDNPAQQARLVDLEPLLAAKFDEMQRTIDVRDDAGLDAAAAIVRADEGKALMDEIRGVLDDVVAEEEALLAGRAAATSRSAATMTTVGTLGTALAVVLGLAVAWALTRSITRPLGHLRERLMEIADGDGDLTQRADDTRGDEVGALAAAFNRFVDNIAGVVREISASTEQGTASAQALSSIAADMTRRSADVAEQTTTAAAAAQQVSTSVQTVAAASEEMGASIQEIARSASEASDAGRTAVTSTEAANETISRLGESSAAIGGVVALINSIAQQTNLLALNATIEAARAGEAGKGFAVVAGEVKELAQQTAQATEEITARITQIQSDVETAVWATSTTTKVITAVNDHQSSIASAVEEQSATTASMSASVAEAALGAATIAENVQTIADLSRGMAGTIDDVRASAEELAQASRHLDGLVGRFKA